jgi:sugar lactone lactonase YvrE
VTWFNAGIRVFDVSDPVVPREVGYHVPTAPAGQPAIQLNDLIVDADGLIYVTDRVNGGLYIFELDAKA